MMKLPCKKIFALLSGLLFSCCIALPSASAVSAPGTYTNYSFSGSEPISSLEMYIKWQNAPASGQVNGTFQFGLGGGGQWGNIGTILDGTTRGANFFISDRPGYPNSATGDASYPNCGDGDDGTGAKCSLTNYNWVAENRYLLRVVLDSYYYDYSNGASGINWRGEIKDMDTPFAPPTVIGVIKVPFEYGFNTNDLQSLVKYGSASTCTGNPSSQVLWEGPYANNGTITASYAYAGYRETIDSPVCMNQNVTTETGRPYVIHTIADNAQITTLPSREIWNPPVVATLPLTPATPGCATFNATINTWGLEDNLWFEYGTNPAFGSTTTVPTATYATYNASGSGSNIVLTEDKLSVSLTGDGTAVSTLGASSGVKWQWEVTVGPGVQRHGMWLSGGLEYALGSSTYDGVGVGWQSSGTKGGGVWANTEAIKLWSTYGEGDILTFGWDADADTLVVYLNKKNSDGTYQNGVYKGTITDHNLSRVYMAFNGGTWYPADSGVNDPSATWTVNYGASPFAHPLFGYAGVYSHSPAYIPMVSTSATPVASTMCGLAANTPYFMRAAGVYNDPAPGKTPATSYGEKRQFILDDSGAIIADSVIVHDAPVVSTTGRINVQQTTATLYGTLHTYGMATEIFGLCRIHIDESVQYSDVNEYVQYGSKIVPAANALVSIDLNLTGLTGLTNYDCHINARSIAGEAISPSNVSFQTGSSTPPPPPDLLISSITAPATESAGSQISIPFQILNQGGGSTVQGFTVNAYLSWTGGSGGRVLLGSTTRPALAAGGTDDATILVTFPNSLAAYSRYRIELVADEANQIVELDETNNSLLSSTFVSVTTGADLTIMAISGVPSVAAPGDTIPINATVCNNGTGMAGQFNVYFYLSQDTSIGAGDVETDSYYPDGLAANTCFTASPPAAYPAKIPANQPIDTYYVIARVDNSNWVPETNEANNTKESGAITVTDNIAPSVPTGLAASAVSATQVNLSWTASTDNIGVTGYRVYRNGAQVGTPSGTSYSDTGLASATTYSYTVAACDAAGNCSAQSSPPVSATTPDNIAPSVPTGLAASAVSATQIDLNWTASTDNVGVTGYKVYRNGAQVGTPSGTSYSDTDLASATTYSYSVAACDAAANCSNPSSPPVSATTKIASAPDLIMTILTASIKSGLLKIADQVKNQGTQAAGSFKVGFYLSLNTTLESSTDIFISCTRSITSLAVNTSNPTGTKTAATSCAIPGTATSGAKYYVIGVADYLNAVGEINELNNSKITAQVTIP